MRQLSINQIKESRLKALQNAEELVNDAEILFQAERWPRVLFLCQISGEEIGKYLLLSSIFVQKISGVDIDWKRVWKRLTSHTEKYELVTYAEDVFLEKEILADIKNYFEKLKDESKELERFKQKSLYCDFTEEIPHCPSDIIGKDIAESALQWAKKRCRLFKGIEQSIQKAKVTEKITQDVIEHIKKEFGLKNLYDKLTKRSS